MKKILVIDDDKTIRKLIKEYLTKMGYHISVAEDGKDGMKIFRNARDFDVVITDVEMPIMNGNAVARLVRASEKPETPILAITGAFDSLPQKELFNIVLPKPFYLERLASLIESFFR